MKISIFLAVAASGQNEPGIYNEETGITLPGWFNRLSNGIGELDWRSANLRQIFGNRQLRRATSPLMQNDVTTSASAVTTTEEPETFTTTQASTQTEVENVTFENFWLIQNDTDSGERSKQDEKDMRQLLTRNEKRKKSKNFEKCNGDKRPELFCSNCAPGYPYYDCEDKGKHGFKCKIECSSSKQHRPLIFQKKIKCRENGWKKNYPSVIRCIERA